ncbi:hypothetical protein ACOMHN_011865 [Nucella lapillus]
MNSHLNYTLFQPTCLCLPNQANSITTPLSFNAQLARKLPSITFYQKSQSSLDKRRDSQSALFPVCPHVNFLSEAGAEEVTDDRLGSMRDRKCLYTVEEDGSGVFLLRYRALHGCENSVLWGIGGPLVYLV